jgi:hypothetical protein
LEALELRKPDIVLVHDAARPFASASLIERAIDIAENLGASADHHAASDFWMTVLVLLAGAAERHVMEDRNIVFDYRGLADHKAGRVVKENSAADLRRRIYVALEYRRRTALQVEREILSAFAIEPVRKTMRLNGMKAFVIKHRLYEPAGSRIAVDGRNDVSAEGFAERRLVLKSVAVGLPDQIG